MMLDARMRVQALLAILFLRDREAVSLVIAARKREMEFGKAGQHLNVWPSAWYYLVFCDRVAEGLKPTAEVTWDEQ
jgi:hypothetical protein